MTNDDLAAKLGHLEGFLKGLGDSIKRIEGAIDKVTTIDRTVAEHAIRFEAQGREIRDLGHDIKNCQHQHQLATDLQKQRIDKLEEDANKVRGVLLAFKIFSGFMAFLLMTGASWIYNRAETNYAINQTQAHDIADLRREVGALQKELGK